MRGAFAELNYRQKLNAQLASLYGATFAEGGWWYANPDENRFFAAVFRLATGAEVSPEQVDEVFAKSAATKQIAVVEETMNRLGVTSEALRVLFEKTPAAGKSDGEFVVVPAPSGAAEADAATRMENGSPTTSGSMNSSVDEVAVNDERAEERTEEEEDDDDATVVADEFNDDIDSFLDEEDDALPALPAGHGVEDELLEKGRKETGCDVNTLVDSLDFLPSQPMECGGAQQDFTGFLKEMDEDSLGKELLTSQFKLQELNALKKSIDLLEVEATEKIPDAKARETVAGHLAAVRDILCEQRDNVTFAAFFS